MLVFGRIDDLRNLNNGFMDIKKSHGGARPGAGRPKGDSKMVSFRLPGDMASRLDAKPNKTDFIRRSLRRALDAEFIDLCRKHCPCDGSQDILPSVF